VEQALFIATVAAVLIALIEVSADTYHYVVVVGLTSGDIVIHDPARSPFQVLTRAAFERAWAVTKFWSVVILPPSDMTPMPKPETSAPATAGTVTPCSGMVTRGVVPFSDGNLLMVVPAQFNRFISLDSTFREFWSRNFVNTPNALQSGYLGSYGGFHFIEDPSMQTTTAGAGSLVTAYQAFACGPHCIGWAPDLSAEVRISDLTDYGRKLSAIWLAIEGWELIDEDRVEKVLMS